MLENVVIHHSVARGYSHIPRCEIRRMMAFQAASWRISGRVNLERGIPVEPAEQRTPEFSHQVIRREGNPTPQGTIAWVREIIISAA